MASKSFLRIEDLAKLSPILELVPAQAEVSFALNPKLLDLFFLGCSLQELRLEQGICIQKIKFSRERGPTSLLYE